MASPLKFNPDCVISVVIKEFSRAEDCAFGVSLEMRQEEVAVFSRVLPGVDRVEAGLRAVLVGLQQAERFRARKILLRVDEKFNLNFLDRHRSAPGKEHIKWIYTDVQEALKKFQLHAVAQTKASELRRSSELAEQAANEYKP